tara:strand:- start:183 stop:440 length:258 start_codon:yes stop_codon:yes gene_type:complete
VKEKPKELSGYEKPIFNLPRLKTKYKKFLYWNILVIFINGITIYRYSGDISLSIELATVLMLSVSALYYFFEKFWKTYKQSIKEE